MIQQDEQAGQAETEVVYTSYLDFSGSDVSSFTSTKSLVAYNTPIAHAIDVRVCIGWTQKARF
jgi:hypothetical protein